MNQQLEQHSGRIRLALYGQSNAALTYNALRIAFGLTGDWWKVALIDSTGCGHKYSHLGMYTTIGMTAPFTPERFYDAMSICYNADMEAIILNITPEYNGDGGLLDRLNHGDFEEALRSHRSFLLDLKESSAHVIALVNTKSRLTVKGAGRLSITQQPVQQPGIDKTFHTILQVDRSNRASVVKDDTTLLPQKQPFPLDAEVGAQLHRWCIGTGKPVCDTMQWKINGCNTMHDLYQLLFESDTDDPRLMAAFTKRRLQLEGTRQEVEDLVDHPF